MKHLLFLILISVSPFNSNFAQQLKWGIKGGATAGTPYMKPEEGASGKLGLGPEVGAFLKYNMNKRISLQTEIYYSFKGASFTTPISGDTNYAQVIMGVTYLVPTSYSGIARGKFKNNYITMPLLLSYKVSEKFNLFTGPQLSYLIIGKSSGTADVVVGADPNYPYTSVKDEPFNESKYLNKWDFSFVFGSMFELNNRISLNLNLSRGFNSVFNKDYQNTDKIVRNIYASFSINITLGEFLKKVE